MRQNNDNASAIQFRFVVSYAFEETTISLFSNREWNPIKPSQSPIFRPPSSSPSSRNNFGSLLYAFALPPLPSVFWSHWITCEKKILPNEQKSYVRHLLQQNKQQFYHVYLISYLISLAIRAQRIILWRKNKFEAKFMICKRTNNRNIKKYQNRWFTFVLRFRIHSM